MSPNTILRRLLIHTPEPKSKSNLTMSGFRISGAYSMVSVREARRQRCFRYCTAGGIRQRKGWENNNLFALEKKLEPSNKFPQKKTHRNYHNMSASVRISGSRDNNRSGRIPANTLKLNPSCVGASDKAPDKYQSSRAEGKLTAYTCIPNIETGE